MTSPQRSYTPEEYLELEFAAQDKHEYLDGRIYAMSGVNRNHVRIASAVNATLYTRLRGRPCESFTSDMQVKVSPTGLYTYPDASALCGEPHFEHRRVDILLNPSLVVEVLSDSTEAYDRGAKFAHYRRIPSLREYVLIAQNRMHAERYTPAADPAAAWVRTDADGPDGVIELPSVGCVLRLADLYERVEFPVHPPGPRRVREPDPAPVA